MAERIQSVRGMNDILPNETISWRILEELLRQCITNYGYEEIRFPLLESTNLFKRSIGEITDIIEKEMYTFNDLNGDSLTLRPEGTAGCLRACLEHGLLHNQQQKLWYMGPMFRHEKPQKGRYRQFHQFGVEAFGLSGVAAEIELILISKRIWEKLGLEKDVHLQLNTLGELHERQKYREVLINYFQSHSELLDQDSHRRLYQNPLRILDSKNPNMQSLIANAPQLINVVGAESKARFDALCRGLDEFNIAYEVNPFLVRGLDYYGHLVFEWVTDRLGSQATVCAGGRYDTLVEQMGGQPTPAIGFAIGMERLILLLDASFKQTTNDFSIFMMAHSEETLQKTLLIAEELRNHVPAIRVIVNTTVGSFKSQFKKADKSGARLALILGENEITEGTITIKDLRNAVEQQTIPLPDLTACVNQFLKTSN